MTDIKKSTSVWKSGSGWNGAAAIGSLLVPGLGQLAQKRFILGIVMFALATATWPIFLGWIFHIWSCFNALRYNDGERFGWKSATALGVCLVLVISCYVIAQNPTAFAKLVARNVMPQPVILDWKPIKNLLADDEVEATVRNKGKGGQIQFIFTGSGFEKTYQTYFDSNETRTIKFSVQGAPSGKCEFYAIPVRE